MYLEAVEPTALHTTVQLAARVFDYNGNAMTSLPPIGTEIPAFTIAQFPELRHGKGGRSCSPD